MKTVVIPFHEAQIRFPKAKNLLGLLNGWHLDPVTGRGSMALEIHDSPRYEGATVEQLRIWRESPIKIVRHTALVYLMEKT